MQLPRARQRREAADGDRRVRAAVQQRSSTLPASQLTYSGVPPPCGALLTEKCALSSSSAAARFPRWHAANSAVEPSAGDCHERISR